MVVLEQEKFVKCDDSTTHGGPQPLGGSQVAEGAWPPDTVVSCEQGETEINKAIRE